jgi:hypothetical protein
MTSLEVLWKADKQKVEELWLQFKLPVPEYFNDITPEERVAILSVISTWDSIGYCAVFIRKLEFIHEQIGKRVSEDILSGIREIEESKLNDEVQEQKVRDFPV